MRTSIPFIALLILAVSGWGLFAYKYLLSGNGEKFYGKEYEKYAPDFKLTDHEGREVTLRQFHDKIVLIAWGYTSCPDVCPLTLSKLKKVMDGLGKNAKDVQVLFISVDPERDTVEKLKSYVPYFNKDFIGVRGSREDIDKAAHDYGVTIVKHPEVYGRSEKDHWDSYLITHTNTVFLVDRDGRLFLTYPHYQSDPEGITADITKLLHNQ
jgi:protein SCO1/2